jgi:hypothetical protein
VAVVICGLPAQDEYPGGVNRHLTAPEAAVMASVRPYVVVTKKVPCRKTADESTVPSSVTLRSFSDLTFAAVMPVGYG